MKSEKELLKNKNKTEEEKGMMSKVLKWMNKTNVKEKKIY